MKLFIRSRSALDVRRVRVHFVCSNTSQRNAGKLRNTRVSSIFATTRGPGLDQLTWMRTSAWGEVPKDVGKVRLGYGLVGHGDSAFDSADEIECYGLGIEGEVRQGPGTARNRGDMLSFRR
jgi:hypothetical protein